MLTAADDAVICTPGDYFRGLRADATLYKLFGRENSVHYETIADTLNFLDTANVYILESPIGEIANEGGYLLYVSRHNWAELIKQSSQSPQILPKNFIANPVWQRVMAFADQWYAGESLCNSLTDGLWFEFDVSGPPPVLPVPSIFFGVENNSAESSVKAIINGLSALKFDLPSIQRGLLNTYVRTIGSLFSHFQVGLMLSRPASPLRICGFGARLPEVLTGLKSLGITQLEDYPDFRQDSLQLDPLFMAVDLDIDTVFGPKVGMEFKFSSVYTIREQQEDKRGRAFLEWLVHKGWCLPETSQAVLNWIGGHKFHPDPKDFWSPRKTILRTISHIKIDFQPGRQPRAKAYLTYSVK